MKGGHDHSVHLLGERHSHLAIAEMMQPGQLASIEAVVVEVFKMLQRQLKRGGHAAGRGDVLAHWPSARLQHEHAERNRQLQVFLAELLEELIIKIVAH